MNNSKELYEVAEFDDNADIQAGDDDDYAPINNLTYTERMQQMDTMENGETVQYNGGVRAFIEYQTEIEPEDLRNFYNEVKEI